MPNRVNALIGTFDPAGFGTNGLQLGVARTDSPKATAWMNTAKYADVLKSLIDRNLNLHGGPPRNLDLFTNGSKMKGRLKSISPDKHSNNFFAELLTLKVNIMMSALSITPNGFGELIYDDGTGVGSISGPGNPFNGMMVKDIAAIGDSMLSARSYIQFPSGGGRIISKGDFDTLYYRINGPDTLPGYYKTESVVRQINSAFEGPLDTTSFADSLRFKGVQPLEQVAYLHANPGQLPTKIIATGKQLSTRRLHIIFTRTIRIRSTRRRLSRSICLSRRLSP
jgi:hypothetical protein